MKVLGLTLALLVLLGLRLDLHHGLGPRGTDGQYYYAQARSLVVDGDLDLRRELGELTPRPENVNTSTDRPWDEPTATGRVPCKYPVGAPLLQVPFLAVGQLLALGLDAAGVEVRTDGYSAPCYLAWRVGVWAFATLLLWAAAGFARRVTGLGPEAGMACAAAAVLCGPLLYFCTGDPYSAHVHSAALVAAALLLAVDPAALPRRLRGTAPLWIGLCCGLAVCTRATNGLWLGAAGLLLLLGGAPDRRARDLALFAGGALLGFAPQPLAWHAVYGSWLTDPYEGEGFALLRPMLGENLFGLRAGLFAWSPAWLPALVAVPLAAAGADRPTRRALLVPAACACALVWVASTWWCWWWGDGYGGRAMASLCVLVAAGFAALRARLLRGRWGLAALALLVLAGAAWSVARISAMERLLPAERATGLGFPAWLR